MAAQRWEYKVVRLIDGQKIEELSVTDQKEKASTVELRDISDLGKEGWELINVVKLDPVRDTLQAPGTNSVNPYAYFKRPVALLRHKLPGNRTNIGRSAEPES
jgi:hypothetical protein